MDKNIENIAYKPEIKNWPDDFNESSKELIELMVKYSAYPLCSKNGKIYFMKPKENHLSEQKKRDIINVFGLKTKKDCDTIREIVKQKIAQLKTSKPIKKWQEDERPRERLIKYGSENLSDAQLLAIILRVGSPDRSAVDLARSLIDRFGSLRALDSVTISELCSIKSVGKAKATEIKAALEIGKRFLKQKSESRKRIKTNDDVVNYYSPYLRDLKKEVFKVMLLDGRNKFIDDVSISEGSLSSSIVDPKQIIKEAVKQSASALIFVHNHPSGESEPTKEDIEITNRLIRACDLVGLRVLDHIIIGNDNYTSFLEKGLIKEE